MKRTVFILSFLLLTAAFCISCEKQQPDEGTLEFTMTKNSLGSSSSYFWIGVQADETVSWTLSLKFEEGEQAWATLREASGNGSKLIACDYQKNESEASRSMTILLVSAGGKSTSYSIAQSGNLPPGAMPDWMELPEPSNDYEFHCHYFKKGYETYRNYSIGWSAENKLSTWVAYPLNSFYTNGGSGYTGTWSYDPDVNTDYQPNLFHGFRSSAERIDRGHQLPSADRQCCTAANNQTFYFTNMTPQRNAFNTGPWVTLEGKIRTFASKSDTLYVVTGAIVGSNPTYAYDNSGKPCPIPSNYFKAVLSYKKNTSSGHSGWQAAGFWLDHINYSGTTARSASLSIRSLESKIGFDLFPNLKAKVGESLYDTIEKEIPTNNTFWGL